MTHVYPHLILLAATEHAKHALDTQEAEVAAKRLHHK
jgi:hypothetical protein